MSPEPSVAAGTAAEGTGALLEVQEVSKSFPGVQALRDVSLSVAAGEVRALVGQNGAGKSTLVKCITGVYRPDAGTIVLDGEPIDTFTPKHASDLGIAVVHQRTQLLPWLSVAENFHLGQMPTVSRLFINRRAANERARALLARFELDIDPEVPVGRLSPAQRQEVAIARALFREAKLLVLDEPTAALDAEQSRRLFALIQNLRQGGIGVLYVSHYLEEVFDLADRVTVLRDGRHVTTRPTAELTQSEVVTAMAGQRLTVGQEVAPEATPAIVVPDDAVPDATAPPEPEQAPSAALRLEGVSTEVLDQVHLEVGPGEVVGVTGIVGAGGHEVARVLFGLTPTRSGRMLLGGEPYAPRGPQSAIDRGLFLVPEDAAGEGLVPALSVASNITLANLGSVTRLGLLGLGRERSLATRFMEELRIAARSVDTAVRNLSGGNQQKVLLAKALMARTRVLVLEEPTQGVDVHAKAEIHRLIRALAAEGRGVLVISTDIRDLLRFVDRLVVLRRGRVVENVGAAETSYAEILDVTVGAAEAPAS